MSTPCKPRPPTYHLRIFAVSLVLVILVLVAFIFGVRLEAVAPATGIIIAGDQHDVRTAVTGLLEPGWYECTLPTAGGGSLAVRLDAQGEGSTDPARPPVQFFHDFRCEGSTLVLRREDLRFHLLRPGDVLWRRQILAAIYPLKDGSAQHSPAFLRAPDSAECWLVLAAPVGRSERVEPGTLIARLVPVDPRTNQPCELLANLDIEESRFGDVAVGQTVRLYSTMYNHRLHGIGEGRIERLEPWGEAAADGRRRFRAVAAVTQAPFPLPLGSSFKAEIVVGRKPVYRIILEQ